MKPQLFAAADPFENGWHLTVAIYAGGRGPERRAVTLKDDPPVGALDASFKRLVQLCERRLEGYYGVVDNRTLVVPYPPSFRGGEP